MYPRILRAAAIVCIAAVCVVRIADAATDWVELGNSKSPAKPSAMVMHSNGNETIIKFTVSGFWREDIIVEGETFQSLRFPGYTTTMDAGRPQLPLITELLAIPGRADVNVLVLEYSTVTLKGYRVAPFQEQLPGRKVKTVFDFDREFYDRDTAYPESMVAMGKPGIWRDLRIMPLTAHPVRCNPALDELTICTELTVKLEYSGAGTTNVKESSARPVKANYDRMYRSLVLNYGFLNLTVEPDGPASATLTDGGYDYLIITPDAYVDNLAPFVAHKDSLGLAMNITPISQIGNNAENIKNYITNEYNTNGIRYVLLAGNESDVSCYNGYYSGLFPSDYYYSLVEGDDDYPDIAVGRFSVEDESQIDNMVGKCISYEANIPDVEWTDNALLIAHITDYPWDRFKYTKECIRDASSTPSGSYSVLYPDFTTAYGDSRKDGGDRATNSDVVREINEGQRVVNYCGHGVEYGWGEMWNYDNETFSTDWVDSLSNSTMTPVVFSIACLTNDVSYGSPCLGEAFTRSEAGAVAFLGATEETVTDVNELYDKKIFSLLFDEGVSNIGDATNAAAVFIIDCYMNTPYEDDAIRNMRAYLWLGDPSLDAIYLQGAPLSAPILVSPQDGEEFFIPPTPRYVTFEWEDLLTADCYEINVDTDTDFINPLFDRDDLTSSRAKTSFDIGAYYWRVRGHNNSGWGPWSEVWWFDVVKRSSPFPDPIAEQTTPGRSGLTGNVPNPFNPTTEIRYDLHKAAHVTIAIFDVNGRHVATLVDCEKEAGSHRVAWNGMNDNGHKACSGLYFCQLRAGNVVESKKIILLR